MHARLAFFLMSAAPTAPLQAQETRAGSRWKNYSAVLLVFGILPGCGEHRDPPPSLSFEGLPVSGSLADALHAGFSTCIQYDAKMRCRRNGVTLEGKGPYNAAVDLDGSDGSGQFDQLTLWHEQDQGALSALADDLKQRGILPAQKDRLSPGPRFFLDKAEPNLLHDVITVIDHALTRPWTVDKTYRRDPNPRPNWREFYCVEGNVHIVIGNENYYLSADGLLMPAKKDQAPPDLRYFKRSSK